ncbi:MAG: ABC transporter substrate-binding protein [Acidobacteriota bacterium]|nr:ABC transporter substrate-binding protein [Acidobacteriota bacterium]
MSRSRARIRLAAAAGLALSLVLTGCLQDPNPRGGGGSGGDFVAQGGTTDGDKVVTIFGAFGGDEAVGFRDSLVEFTNRTGIAVEYNNSTDFTTLIKARVRSGDTPDIAIYPQPGGLAEQAAERQIQPIDTFLDYDTINSTLIPGFLDAARINGRVYGAPMRMAVKSIVWYPESYKATGLPTEFKSVQEMQQVATQIKDGGTTPWCVGFESGAATGWPATDWIEELVLRMWGPDVYDQWTKHKIPFNDERIVAAFEEMERLLLTDGMSFGGRKGILATAFGNAMDPAFQTPPSCYWMRQGNFVSGMFPKDIQANLDTAVGTTVFPPYEGGFAGQPILGGGDIAALFNGDDPDAIEVMKFLTSDQFGAEWAKKGGWLSPHRTFDQSNYPDETTRRIAEMASNADVFRYDGSDLMPNAVGGGTFWSGMVDFTSGQKSAQDVADAIENSWPES